MKVTNQKQSKLEHAGQMESEVCLIRNVFQWELSYDRAQISEKEFILNTIL
jgi:hypothetical protein